MLQPRVFYCNSEDYKLVYLRIKGNAMTLYSSMLCSVWIHFDSLWLRESYWAIVRVWNLLIFLPRFVTGAHKIHMAAWHWPSRCWFTITTLTVICVSEYVNHRDGENSFGFTEDAHGGEQMLSGLLNVFIMDLCSLAMRSAGYSHCNGSNVSVWGASKYFSLQG